MSINSLTSHDNIETLLILSMEKMTKSKNEKFDTGKKRLRKEIIDSSRLLNIKEKRPSESYTFDASSDDRLYTSDINLLAKNPLDTINDGLETILFFEQSLKWMRFEPTRKPRGRIALGKVESWIAVHFRTCDIYGNQEYIIDAFPVKADGTVLPYKVEGWNLSNNKIHIENQEQMVLSCSVIEDAVRPDVLLAKASVESSIIFPIEYGAHKEFFSLRDGPNQTKTGKKNPIIHFCKKHMRKRGQNNTHVKGHWRGCDKISINGMTIEISTEGFDHDE